MGPQKLLKQLTSNDAPQNLSFILNKSLFLLKLQIYKYRKK